MSTENVEVTEPIEPDEEEFDVEDWLGTGNAGRAKKTVTIYNDVSLIEEAKELEREINKAEKEADEKGPEDLALGESSTSDLLRAKQEKLLEKIEKAKAIVEVKSISGQEIEEIEKEYRKKHGKNADPRTSTEGTCRFLEVAAKMNGKPLSWEQWLKVEDHIAGGQWLQIRQAWLAAQSAAPSVSGPFSGGGSRLSKAVLHS